MIRPATSSDCIDLVALSIQVYLHTYAVDGIRSSISTYVLSRFSVKAFEEYLKKPAWHTLVYIENDHLVGYITVDLDARFDGDANGYEIETLYVQEHFHGRGIGKKLLNEAAKLFGHTYWLSTWVLNHNAIDFYTHLGFRKIGNVEFKMDDELIDNFVLAYASVISS